jgi:hypothetical protein
LASDLDGRAQYADRKMMERRKEEEGSNKVCLLLFYFPSLPSLPSNFR